MALPAPSRSRWLAAAAGAAVGVLGGMIGLGGAEFRLPLLIGLFGFPALAAVILNKATSLCVVAVALPARATAVPFTVVADHAPVIAVLLAGSLAGAWAGAAWAIRLGPRLQRVLAVLLLAMAVALLVGHDAAASGPAALTAPRIAAGIVAGFGIGVVSALLGVAGGELLIPTLVLLFGIEPRIAGSLSLAISLPTMLVAFGRYRRDRGFAVLGAHRGFLLALAAGSALGAAAGGLLVGAIPDRVLIPLLAFILVVSAVKVWRHAPERPAAGGDGTAPPEASS